MVVRRTVRWAATHGAMRPDLATAGPGRRRRTIVLRGYESLPALVPSLTRTG